MTVADSRQVWYPKKGAWQWLLSRVEGRCLGGSENGYYQTESEIHFPS